MARLTWILVLLILVGCPLHAYLPGPDIIRQCPGCKTAVSQQTMQSGNTFGAAFWTDGKMDAPMLPDHPAVVKCPECGLAFWLEDAKKLGEDELGGGGEPVLPSTAEYIRMAATEKNRDRRLYLRARAWRAANDKVRDSWGVEPALAPQTMANMKSLYAMLAEKDPDERIMKAEVARELGDFDTAIKLLDYAFDEYYRDTVVAIRLLAEAKCRNVAKLPRAILPITESDPKRPQPKPSDWEKGLFMRALSEDSTPCVLLLLERYRAVDLLDAVSPDPDVLKKACGTGDSYALSCAAERAVEEDSLSSIRLLLDSGMKADIETDYGPLLTIACTYGREAIAGLLVERGAGLEPGPDSGTKTALMHAVELGRAGIAKMLVAKGAKIDARDDEGNTALMLACQDWGWGRHEDLAPEQHRTDTLGTMKALIDGGADVHAVGSDSWAGEEVKITPLIAVCLHSDPAGLIPPKKASKDEFHPLAGTKVDMVRMLLDGGADVNKTDSRGKTPLAYACEKGNSDIAELLIARGADVNLGAPGSEPLASAAREQKWAVLRLLLRHGAKSDTGKSSAMTALMWACYHNQPELVSLLLEKGADITTRDSRGWMPLHCAVDSTRCAKLLIEAGADVNARDSKGMTVLMCWAEGYGDQDDLIDLLLASGADPKLKNNAGKTALEIAEKTGLDGRITALKKSLSKSAAGGATK